MRNTAAKLTFIILTFNITFINKSFGYIKKDALFKTRPKPKVNMQLRWISLFSKCSQIKTTASDLSYELGVNGEKSLMETGILLLKMGIAHFTKVNLEILTVQGKQFEFDIVTLKLIENESQCQKIVMVINVLQMICIGHVLKAPGPYQQALLQILE